MDPIHNAIDAEPDERARLKFGPGLLVTAAFIGPGTVVTASRAGATYGCGLLWVIVVSVVCAIILQQAAARLGVITGMGLGEHIRNRLQGTIGFKPVAILVVAAMGVGNSAYQTGNLTGAAAGAMAVFGGGLVLWVLLLTVCCAAMILTGTYRNLQLCLVGLVVLLSLAFIAAASVRLPDSTEIAKGMLPRFETISGTLTLALVGTTIVPYNLFLHASSAAKNWQGSDRALALRQANWDTVLAIVLGGFVTAAIVVTASSVFHDSSESVPSLLQLSGELEPVLGQFAAIGFGLGMLAAGLTSSITAPVATAFAISGILGWTAEIHSAKFRCVALTTLAVGALFALAWGSAPANTIVIAQVANGLLLPFVAVLVVWAAFQGSGRWLSALAQFLVCGVVIFLAMWKMASVLF